VAHHLAGPPLDLSCRSRTSCFAAISRSPGSLRHFDGHSWSAPRTVPGFTLITSVSCTSTQWTCAVAGRRDPANGRRPIDLFARRARGMPDDRSRILIDDRIGFATIDPHAGNEQSGVPQPWFHH